MPLHQIVKNAFDGLDDIFTSDEERAKYQLALKKLEHELNISLIERNKAVALQSWIGRWPDMIGSVLALGLIIDLILRPILALFGVILPDLNEQELMAFAGTLLGVRGIDAFAKRK